MEKYFRDKTIFVTGGAGSIGSEIVAQLLKFDIHKVIIFSRDEIKHMSIKKKLSDNRVETVIGDTRDYRSIERVFLNDTIDIIYHAAAMKHVIVSEESPIECVKTNVIGTQNIVDIAKKFDVPKLITISTDKSASPANTMGASKLIAENITLNSGYSCVRFGNVANSRGSVIPIFVENVIQKKQISITDRKVTRFLMEIPDAAKLVLKATLHSKGGDIFILKMKSFLLGDLLDTILDRIAPELGITRDEINVITTGLLPIEKRHEDLVSPTEIDRLFELDDMYVILRDHENMSSYPNIRKAALSCYSSNILELFDKDDLEQIVKKYLSI